MKKIIRILVMILLLSTSVYACKDQYLPNEEVIIEDTIVDFAFGADCNITIYNNMSVVSSGNMTRNGLDYIYQAGILPRGGYVGSIVCNLSTVYYYENCNFIVEEGYRMYLALSILMLGGLGFFFYIGYKLQTMYFGQINIRPLKWMMFVLGGWLLVGILNIAVVGSVGLGIDTTIAAFYRTVLYAMSLVSLIWLLDLIFYSINFVMGWAKEVKSGGEE